MSLVRVVAPMQEVVQLPDLKEFLRVDISDDDDVLLGLRGAIQSLLEGKDSWGGRALITQTWEWGLWAFPTAGDRQDDDWYSLVVPLPPLQAVESITYVDGEGNPQTLPPADYLVDTKSEPGRIVPAFFKHWPAVRPGPNAVTVRFVAGYGPAAAVPEFYKTWIKNGVGHLYQFREAASLPPAFFDSIASYRMPSP